MNLRPMLIALMLPLAACSATPDAPPLAGARIGGPFALTDQNGQRRTDRDFAGRYRVMYFGYTYCPDVCPTDVAHLVAGYRALKSRDPAKANKVVPIFVSVDPARDTPAVLKQFVSAFDPALVGLTGTPAQIAALAAKFGVVFQAQKPVGNDAYLVDHSRAAFLMGPDGAPIALLSQDEKPEVIAGELAKWVR